jgi:nuclear pore complex protein Nup133
MEENFREKLLDAMKWEDATLRKYVEHCQLNKWTQTALEAAQKTTDFYFDSITAAGANADGNGNGSANGHSKTANGVASNGKA